MIKFIKNYFEGIQYIIKDVLNYFYIASSVIKHKNDLEWNAMNIRYDWVFRIYTVVSLKEEDLEQEEDFQSRMIIERTMPINDYLCDKVELIELLTPRVSRINDSLSYLVIYYPVFYQLSIFYVLYYTISLTLLGFGINYLYDNYYPIRNFLIIIFFKLRGLF